MIKEAKPESEMATYEIYSTKGDIRLDPEEINYSFVKIVCIYYKE